MKVMFVCLGNICRSPAAQAVFDKRLEERGLTHMISTGSSGTCAYHVGQLSDRRMRKAAKQVGIDIYHHAQQFSYEDFEEYDLILAMDRENYHDLMREAHHHGEKQKIRMFRSFDPEGNGDVPDPYYGGEQGFNNVLVMLLRTCDIIIDRILEGEI